MAAVKLIWRLLGSGRWVLDKKQPPEPYTGGLNFNTHDATCQISVHTKTPYHIRGQCQGGGR